MSTPLNRSRVAPRHETPNGRIVRRRDRCICTSVVALFVAAISMQSALADHNIPAPHEKVKTPETTTPGAEEAARALECDWLFQAMTEPLLQRAGKEIVWTRELANRLSRQRRIPELSAELREMKTLEQRLGELQRRPPRPVEQTAPKKAAAKPVWIWFAEGRHDIETISHARNRVRIEQLCNIIRFAANGQVAEKTARLRLRVFPRELVKERQ